MKFPGSNWLMNKPLASTMGSVAVAVVAGNLVLTGCSSFVEAKTPPNWDPIESSTVAGSSQVSYPPTPRATPPSAAPSATSSPTPLVTADSTATTGNCPHVSSLSLDQQLRQTLMVWVFGSAETVPASYFDLGGIFLGGSAPVTGTFTGLQGAEIPPLIAVEEEGGRVQRIAANFGALLSARKQAKLTTDEVEARAYQRGLNMRSLGITMDLAPVVDLNNGPAKGEIGDRSYGDTAAQVIAYAGAFARGLQRAGVLPTLKHFPGVGAADGDSPTRLPSTGSHSMLEQRDLLPYQALVQEPGPWVVMVGNRAVPGLTHRGLPAFLDPKVYVYLRQNVGFRGLVLTDDLLGMKSAGRRYTASSAAITAIAAGADMVLLSQPGSIDQLIMKMTKAVNSGTLPASRVASAASHVLMLKKCQ